MKKNKKEDKELQQLKSNINNTIQIPLMVKEKENKNKVLKNKNNKPDIQQKTSQKDKINNAILLGIIVLLLLITSYVILNKMIDEEKKPLVVAETKVKKNNKNNINTKWVTADDSMFHFDKDNNFYWYDDYTNKKDNYYEGTYTYTNGLEALEEMGYTEEDYNITFKKDNIKIDNIYSIKVQLSSEVINNVRKNKEQKWWLIMLIIDNKNAVIYNKTLDTRYTLTKK